MKYWLKSTLGSLISLLVIILIAIVVIILTFNPNHYKAEISQWVHTQTGRVLTLDGDIHVSLLPLSLELNQVRLHNPSGFKATEFINIEHVKLRIIWLPLLEQKIETDAMQLNGVQLVLMRQADGKVNWKNLLPSTTTRTQAASSSITPQDLLKSLQIKQLSVSDSQIIWDDRVAKTHYSLANLNFTTQIHADLENNVFQLLTVKIASALEHDSNKQVISLTIPQIQLDIPQQKLNWESTALQFGEATLQTQLHVTQLLSNPTYHAELQVSKFNPAGLLSLFNITNPQLPKTVALAVQMDGSLTGDHIVKNLAVKLDDTQLQLTEAKFNLSNQTLDTDNLKLHVLGTEVLIQLKATELFSKPTLAIQTQALGLTLASHFTLDLLPKPLIHGTLKLNKFDVRALAAKLKQQLPETVDKKVFTQLTLETQLDASLTQVDLHHVNIVLDESVLTGDVKIQNFQQPTLSFQLNLDNIDVDRYLPPTKSGKSAESGIPIPMELLKKLNINGMLKVTHFKMAKVLIKEMNFKFVTKDGKVKVSMSHLFPDFTALLKPAKPPTLAKIAAKLP
jgi:AsmA protein